MQSRGTVLIVDHDSDLLESIESLLRLHNYWVRTFSSVESFLAYSLPNTPSCAIIDAEMPGFTGRQLHQLISTRRPDLPIIQLTQHGSIPQAVQAIRDGATDFLTKPVENHALVYAVQRAFVEEERLRPQREQRALFEKRFATLTLREREVCAHVLTGKLNKQIAVDLGTCEKTVKVHRARVMKKLGVESVAELVRFALVAVDAALAGPDPNGGDLPPGPITANGRPKPEARNSGLSAIAALLPVLSCTASAGSPPRPSAVAA
jgi:FixJ family two-component response regulator